MVREIFVIWNYHINLLTSGQLLEMSAFFPLFRQLLERAVKQLAAPSVGSTSGKTSRNGLNSLDAVFDSVLSASAQNEATTGAISTPTKKVSVNSKGCTLKTASPTKQQQNAMIMPNLAEDLRAEVQKILTVYKFFVDFNLCLL